MQITRYTSLDEAQFLGCLSAFIDSLFGALNSSVMYLKKLEGQPKGAAFAFEIQMDQGRYGALLVLERWAEFVRAFAPTAVLPRYQAMLDQTPRRVETAEDLLARTNQVLDAAAIYSAETVSACISGFQALKLTFEEEQAAASQAVSLGPLLSEGFKEYRRVFLGDLASR